MEQAATTSAGEGTYLKFAMGGQCGNKKAKAKLFAQPIKSEERWLEFERDLMTDDGLREKRERGIRSKSAGILARG